MIRQIAEGARQVGWYASDLYVAASTNVGAVAGATLTSLLSAEIAHINFTSGEPGRAAIATLAAVALGGLAFDGAARIDRITAKAERARAAGMHHNI